MILLSICDGLVGITWHERSDNGKERRGDKQSEGEDESETEQVTETNRHTVRKTDRYTGRGGAVAKGYLDSMREREGGGIRER